MKYLLSLTALVGLVAAGVASACPCGCGTIAAGTLEPGQKTKFVTTAVGESRISTISADGSEIPDYLYDRSMRTDFVATQALAPRLALTGAAQAYRNAKGDRTSQTLPGDVSASLAFLVTQQDFTRPWQPRLDAYLAYKHAVARSFATAAKDPTADSFLAVGGNGLNELAIGTQSWSGMKEWKLGTSLRYVAFPEVIGGHAAGPQAGASAAVKLARVFMGRGGMTLETGVEWIGEVVDDGKPQRGSSRRIDHASLAGSFVLVPSHSLGISVARKNVFGLTRNAVGGQSITLSYQAVLL